MWFHHAKKIDPLGGLCEVDADAAPEGTGKGDILMGATIQKNTKYLTINKF